MASPLALVRKYRTPLLLAGGGLAAYTAFQASRGRASATQAAAIAAAAPAGSSPGMTPEQVAALYGGAQQGALGLFNAGLAPTEAALGLAGSVVGIAGQVAGGSLDALTGLAGTLGSVAGTAVGVLPSFAPAEGIQPQSTAPIAPAAPTVTETFDGYYAYTKAGTYMIYTVDQAGAITGQRSYTFSGGRVRVRRSTSATQHWRIIEGALNGWSLRPGLSGPYSVVKVYNRSDGTARGVDIGQWGS